MRHSIAISICLICIVSVLSFSQGASYGANDIHYDDAPELLKEIERLKTLYQQQDSGAPKYDRSGHQYTTFIVARLAGLDREMSHKLAYYSQFPDDVTKYSATSAAINVFNQKYRKQIMVTLHSLHGGDERAVLHTRSVLKNVIKQGIRKNTLHTYQVGLVIHALADSYAHTTIENGKLKAFGSVVGHLWHGHTPDIIAYDPPKYKDYVCNLFMALKGTDSCKPHTDELMAMLEGLKKNLDAELLHFEKLAKEKYTFSEDYYSIKDQEWKNAVKEEDILSTLKYMDGQLNNAPDSNLSQN